MTEEADKKSYSNGMRTSIEVSIHLNSILIKDISRRKKSCKKRKVTTGDVSTQVRPSLITDHISSSKSRRKSVEELPPVCKRKEEKRNIELEEEENVTEDQDKAVTTDMEFLEVGMANGMVHEKLQDGSLIGDRMEVGRDVEEVMENVTTTSVKINNEENNECQEEVTENEVELIMSQNRAMFKVENVCSFFDALCTEQEDQSLTVSSEDPVLTVDDPDINIPLQTMTRIQEIQSQQVDGLSTKQTDQCLSVSSEEPNKPDIICAPVPVLTDPYQAMKPFHRRRSVEELPPACKGKEKKNMELEEEENVTENQDKTEKNDVIFIADGMEDGMVNEELVDIEILADIKTGENSDEHIDDVTENMSVTSQNVTSVQVENVCSYMTALSTKKEDQSLSVSPEDPVLTVDDPDQANKPFHYLTQFLMDLVPPVSSLNISDIQTISRTMAKITEIQSQLVENLVRDKA